MLSALISHSITQVSRNDGEKGAKLICPQLGETQGKITKYDSISECMDLPIQTIVLIQPKKPLENHSHLVNCEVRHKCYKGG